jgi:hypothetical protein
MKDILDEIKQVEKEIRYLKKKKEKQDLINAIWKILRAKK